MKSPHSGRLPALGLGLLVLLGLTASPSIPRQALAPSEQAQRKTSTPYTGDLSAFDYKDRDKKLQIEKVMDILGIGPGKNVADIGAGSGWFSVRAARRVAPAGVIYAVDINPEAIRYIRKRVVQENVSAVQAILSKPEDPLLPAGSVDTVLLLDTYHEIAQPVTLLKNLHRALRPGSRLGIIDRNGNGENHGVSREIVVREAGEAGYSLVGEYDFVKSDREDYFLVFEPQVWPLQ